jgi:hypothetical protein
MSHGLEEFRLTYQVSTSLTRFFLSPCSLRLLSTPMSISFICQVNRELHQISMPSLAKGKQIPMPSCYGGIPHNAGFDFLDLTPSILLLRQFWD